MSKVRLAVIDKSKCKPKKCNKECRRVCPPVTMGKQCIEIEEIAKISEYLCIGCGSCVRVCPFNAIKIVNLPVELNKEQILYQYSENSFRMYKLPKPKPGKIIGILGENGVGKSTLLKVLSGSIKPNFGDFNSEFKIAEIKNKVKGTELQKFLNLLYSDQLKISMKPQNVESLIKKYKKSELTVQNIIEKYYNVNDEYHQEIVNMLEFGPIYEEKIKNLSGGQVQKLTCACVMMQNSDVYIFDEPSNFLDVRQRLSMSFLIQKLVRNNRYIFIVEHDISILDYLSDIICIMYGKNGAYGVVSQPQNSSEAINNFFSGYIRSDNIKFRKEAYKFNDNLDSFDNSVKQEILSQVTLSYPKKKIDFQYFTLNIEPGTIEKTSSIVVMVGKNGSGKSTFLNFLSKYCNLSVSYKHQYNDPSKISKTTTNVRDLLYSEIKSSMCSDLFISDVINPFKLSEIYDKNIATLSGGELQKVAITLCLGRNTDVYLIDEPSSSLDVEQRVIATKIIKRFLIHNQKIGFIVEHDMMMAMTLGSEVYSKIIVFEEEIIDNPNGTIRNCLASQPLNFNQGINKFLQNMNITFRTDIRSSRPRINKLNSQKDIEQKSSDHFYV